MNITEYTIITEDDHYGLCRSIREAIAHGWQPLGGVSVSGWSHGTARWSQALVKYAQPIT
jgi:hypothetical protein